MKSNIIMTTSSLSLGAVALCLTFLPQEIASSLEFASTHVIFLQIIGGLYFGFAMLNWMTKENLMGGIYGRPVIVANMSHFLIVGLALVKLAFRNSDQTSLWVVSIAYISFAAAFMYLFLNNPKFKES
ncbi:MAG: hypothetical protein JXQ96_13830 [Cyclobacteriaceae bacterium]